jgi:pimeloyl-ACP methyl ester carboxylesterase
LSAVIGVAVTLASTLGTAAAGDCDSILIGNKRVTCLANRSLLETNPAILRAIIVIHGGYRIPEEYYAPILVALAARPDLENYWRSRTIVLAPHFKERSEAAPGEHWWRGDWREGGESDGVSSYTVVDLLVKRLRSGRFPNLKWIIITGHSSGGQFTQRYAAFTDVDQLPAPHAALLKFVPANPSSYVYLNEYRRGATTNEWIVPKQDCPTGDRYNEWKYGLEGLSGYPAARGAEFARAQLPQRRIEVLAGTADVLTGEGFDDDCAGMIQGATRFERARNFKAFMDRFYPTNQVTLTLVPGVGHSGPGMLASPEGLKALFFAE